MHQKKLRQLGLLGVVLATAACEPDDRPETQPGSSARGSRTVTSGSSTPRRAPTPPQSASDIAGQLRKELEALSEEESAPQRGSAETAVVARRPGAAARIVGPPDATSTGRDGGLRLEVAFRKTAAELVLTYRVVNEGRQDAYLFTPLDDYDYTRQVWVTAPERLYSTVSGGLLSLTKRMVPIPRGRMVYAPEVPKLTPLTPGAELRETVRLPLPLRLDHPYRDRSQAAGPRSRSVAFSIGYLRAADLLPGMIRQVSAQPFRYRIAYAQARRRQRILRSRDVALRVATVR